MDELLFELGYIKVIEFDTPAVGLSSPINRSNPSFVGFGRTAGGAREFTIPNQTIPLGATKKIVR
ncbi:polymorphic toxin type 10 domain-containing protein [Sphingobacterium sp. LRF_L2]|uniref:polymorphic toxin type 10 domain-containing protein n=1 Tax=Sphingobacterium sp. LRF_L2 TaxID=3369421 RepID=UPI003F5DB123